MAPAVVERLVGWATGVVGRLAEWFVGHLGRAVRWVGRQARTFVEPLLEPLRLLYAFIAARIGTWILALVLMVVYCAVAAAVAVVLYLFLYHNFVPIIAFHKPVYFDFTRAEPWAVADFADKWSPSGRPQGADHLRPGGGGGGGPTVVATPVLSPGHLYDFALDLQLPDSPINDRIGMFMVTLSLYSWNGDLLANSSRPCRVRYRTDLLQKMWTVFWSVPLVLGLMEEKQALRLELLSNHIDTHASPFGYATVALSHRELEVYSAELHIEARLSGISYFCYYWFFTAMAVFVPLIFLAETWLIILTWLVIYFLLPTSTGVAPSSAPSAPLVAPVSPAERRRRIAGIGRANEAAAATVAAAAAAPLAGLEELGHEARSPALPRQPGLDADDDDQRRRAQEDDDDDVALQELLEREIARKLKAVEEEEEEEEGDDDEGEEEEEEEEDTGAGVFPRLRRRRPRRAAVAAAQLEGAALTPPTSDAEHDSDNTTPPTTTLAPAAADADAEADPEDKTKLD